jgi:hypothetical protein
MKRNLSSFAQLKLCLIIFIVLSLIIIISALVAF